MSQKNIPEVLSCVWRHWMGKTQHYTFSISKRYFNIYIICNIFRILWNLVLYGHFCVILHSWLHYIINCIKIKHCETNAIRKYIIVVNVERQFDEVECSVSWILNGFFSWHELLLSCWSVGIGCKCFFEIVYWLNNLLLLDLLFRHENHIFPDIPFTTIVCFSI